jgi:hypothetical protein
MTIRYLLVFALLPAFGLWLAGCDLAGSRDNGPSRSDLTSGVYVTNGGAFGNQNSSYTVFDPTFGRTAEIPPDRPPGFSSYIQSTTLHEHRNYLLFGETNAIGVFSATNQRIAQIEDVVNPRYMDVSGQTAYVTGQNFRSPSASKLYEVDLSTNSLVDSVAVGGTPEGVLATADDIFVALGGPDGTVAAVTPSPLSVAQTIPVRCDAPRSLALDQQNELLVFCAGATIRNDNFEVVDRTDGAIQVLDPDTKALGPTIPLDTTLASATQGKRVSYAPATDEAFAVLAGQTVLRLDASRNQIIDRFDVPGNPIGTIGYSPAQNRLYVGRGATDVFGANGTVTVHALDGRQTNTIDAGVAPIDIDFRLDN